MLTLYPADCSIKQIHKLLTGIVVPRPVALVSTMDRDGRAAARLPLQEAFPGLLFLLQCPFRKEDIAGLMPLTGFLRVAIPQGNLVGSRPVVALGPGKNGAIEGDCVVGNNHYLLTYIEHRPSLRKRVSYGVYPFSPPLTGISDGFVWD
jgi:hypothetical protein